jgi:long-chain acyl-CoA synthetase
MDDKPWLKMYDKGVPFHIDYPKVTVFNLLENTAQKHPDSICTIFKGARITYKEMNELTDRRQHTPGSQKASVGIFMRNTPQFVIIRILKQVGCRGYQPVIQRQEIDYQVNNY